MTVFIEQLRDELEGMALPGGDLLIEAHEAAIGDAAWRADLEPESSVAHPIWFIIASLRCMGVSVDDLCALAHKAENDLLLFGGCTVVQTLPLIVGDRYRIEAEIIGVRTRTGRDGSRLDTVEVVVRLRGARDEDFGAVTSEYLFKRSGS